MNPPNTADLWAQVLAAVAAAGDAERVATWLADLELITYADGVAVIRVPDETRARLVRDHYRDQLRAGFSEVAGEEPELRFETPLSAGARGAGPISDGPEPPSAALRRQLNPAYRLDSFVEGKTNRLALAACRAVAEKPGTLYNPLFIHGPPGTGKTHLLQALCAELSGRLNCLYLHAADLDAVLPPAPPEASPLAACSLLAVDAVDALADRPECQENLFHSFNAMHSRGVQMIFSGPARPGSLPGISERLASRLGWGLVVGVDAPLPDTIALILAAKAEQRGLDIPRQLLDELASSGQEDVRVLEGLMARAAAGFSLVGTPPDRATIRQLLSSLPGVQKADSPLSTERIQHAVAAAYGLKAGDLLGPSRSRSVTLARHIAIYLTKRMTTLQLKEIGGHFGGRDHSTVLYAIGRIERLLTSDKSVAEIVRRTKDRLKSL